MPGKSKKGTKDYREPLARVMKARAAKKGGKAKPASAKSKARKGAAGGPLESAAKRRRSGGNASSAALGAVPRFRKRVNQTASDVKGLLGVLRGKR